MRIYAIGDVHGYLQKLKSLIRRIKNDAGRQPYKIIFLGDLVDRGPNSRGVIEYIIDRQNAGEDWQVVKGNHDDYLLRYGRGEELSTLKTQSGLSWFNPRMGGSRTVKSFGINKHILDSARTKVSAEILDWMEELPYSIEIENYFFVHAGVDPARPLNDQDPFDLMWIRKPFFDHKESFGPLIIHGHTPVEKVTFYGNRVNVDTGAGYGKHLSALVIEGSQMRALNDVGCADIETNET